MKQTVFINSSVIEIINKHFIPVRIDIDSESDLANNYGILGVPTTIILAGNAKVVDTLNGYVDATKMANFLNNNIN